MPKSANDEQSPRSVTNLSDADIKKLIDKLQALQNSQLQVLQNELSLKIDDETTKVTNAVKTNVDDAEVEIKKKIEEIPKSTM